MVTRTAGYVTAVTHVANHVTWVYVGWQNHWALGNAVLVAGLQSQQALETLVQQVHCWATIAVWHCIRVGPLFKSQVIDSR